MCQAHGATQPRGSGLEPWLEDGAGNHGQTTCTQHGPGRSFINRIPPLSSAHRLCHAGPTNACPSLIAQDACDGRLGPLAFMDTSRIALKFMSDCMCCTCTLREAAEAFLATSKNLIVACSVASALLPDVTPQQILVRVPLLLAQLMSTSEKQSWRQPKQPRPAPAPQQSHPAVCQASGATRPRGSGLEPWLEDGAGNHGQTHGTQHGPGRSFINRIPPSSSARRLCHAKPTITDECPCCIATSLLKMRVMGVMADLGLWH